MQADREWAVDGSEWPGDMRDGTPWHCEKCGNPVKIFNGINYVTGRVEYSVKRCGCLPSKHIVRKKHKYICEERV